MKFAKMQATGNDFILIEGGQEERNWPELSRAMCHRHFGVGSDGLILLLSSKVAELGMRMFNPDGSEAEACGNGLRCVARYALGKGLAGAGGEFMVETMSGTRRVKAVEQGIQVDMGVPRLKPDEIPMQAEDKLDIIIDYPVTVDGEKLLLTCLSIGNPHAVFFASGEVTEFPLSTIGPQVENHPIFPNRVNFEIANVLGRNRVRARVWERGAGETLSCGSGACAVAVAARLHGHVDRHVDIMLPGGTLAVYWDAVEEVMLSGPAQMVFWGEWSDQAGTK
jgi:diaminopimelate epimerase